MRSSATLFALACLLLPGCLSAGDGPGGGQTTLREGTPTELGHVLGYHARLDRERHANVTLFVVRDNGTAERLTYVDDHSASIRLAPGLSYPEDDLRLVFSHEGGNQNRSAGGLVIAIDHGVVPEPQYSALRDVLAPVWALPLQDLDSPTSDDYVRVPFPGRGAQIARDDGTGDPALKDIREAFAAAEGAYQVTRAQTATLPQEAPDAGCVDITMRLEPAVARPGEPVDVHLAVRNCGAEAVTLGQSVCDASPILMVGLLPGVSRPHDLPVRADGAAAYALDLACHGEKAPLALQAGETRNVTRRWNGTLGECPAGGACVYAPAEPGRIHVVAYTGGRGEPAGVDLLVMPQDGPKARFLLAREWDWANATHDEPIMGHFGPHCAPVSYTLEPPTLTLRRFGGEESETGGQAATPEAFVVRDWRHEGHRPGNVVTVSADRLDAIPFENGAARLASPFNQSVTLATLARSGEDFLVNGTRLAPGESVTLRDERDLVERGRAYRVASVVELRNVGVAEVLHETMGGCL